MSNQEQGTSSGKKSKFIVALLAFITNKKNLPLVASIIGGGAVVTTSALLLAPQRLPNSSESSSMPTSNSSSSSSSIISSISSSSSSASVISSSANPSSEAMFDFTVTFNTMGGIPVDAVRVNQGDLINEPISSQGFMSLEGWYTSNDNGITLNTAWDFTQDTVTADLTLYALWVDPYVIEFSRITTTEENIVFIDQFNKVWMWGKSSPIPVPLSFPFVEANEIIVHIAGGAGHTLALSNEGNIYGIGDNYYGQLGLSGQIIETMTLLTVPLDTGERILSVWAGYSTSFVITSKGRLLAMGENYEGELGLPSDDTGIVSTFTEIEFSDLYTNERMINFYSADYGSFAISNFGRVFSWGYEWDGRLGNGPLDETVLLPTLINFPDLLPNEYVQRIDIWSATAVALTNLNRVYGWGDNGNGELAANPNDNDYFDIPTLMDLSFLNEGDQVQKIDNGAYHTALITTAGLVYQFGDNDGYQLNTGDDDRSFTPVLLDASAILSDGESIIDIYAGNESAFFITSNDDILGIGYNDYGMIDHPSVEYVTSLKRILFFAFNENERFLDVAVGEYHTIALTTDNRLFGWGWNNRFQLGLEDVNFSTLAPIEISVTLQHGETLERIYTTGYSNFALTSLGRLLAWGENDEGELGNNGTENQQNPIEIPFSGLNAGEKIITFTASYYGNYAITNQNRVFGFGSTFTIGDGTDEARKIPTLIPFTGLNVSEKIVSIESRYTQQYALTSEGRVFAWGNNDWAYQLGLGDLVNRNAPTLMTFAGLAPNESIMMIAGGAQNALALTTQHRIFGWGFNTGGQLGNNGTDHVQTPTLIDYQLPNSAEITSIYGSSGAGFFLVTTDGLYTFGNNGNYQIGHTLSGNIATPTKVEFTDLLPGETITNFSLTSYSTFAITSLGRLYSWGFNDAGKLGHFSTWSESIGPKITVISKLIV